MMVMKENERIGGWLFGGRIAAVEMREDVDGEHVKEGLLMQGWRIEDNEELGEGLRYNGGFESY